MAVLLVRRWWVVVAVAILAAWSSVDAEESPLQITLDAPAICETEPRSDFITETVEVGWQVNGGRAPYELLIGGELYQGASGLLEVPCNRWAWDRVGSGPITIQATVTDANGQKASALGDIYALRRISRTPRGSYEMLAGETYRVHQLLVTMPLDGGADVSRYVTDDCNTWRSDCADRFQIWLRNPGDIRASSLWIRRWTGTEHSRVLVGEEFAFGQLDEADLVWDQQVASDFFDSVLGLIGEEPRVYRVTQPVGPEDPGMAMKLYAPTYCLVGLGPHQHEYVDVSWSVNGGRDQLEVTIAGERYVGREGRVKVPCGLGWLQPRGGHQRLQGTAVDADGRSTSARADMYAIGHSFESYESLPEPRPYRIGDLVVLFPPEIGTTVTAGPGWHEGFRHCWITDENVSVCENAVRLTFMDGERSASFVLGLRTATIHERTPRGDATPALNGAIDRLIGSLGTPPPLPDGFVESSAPLEITAFVDPAVCEYDRYGGSGDLYWTATGGRWWPLSVTVNGRHSGRAPTFLECQEVEPAGEVTIEVSEYGSSPARETMRVPVMVRETDFENNRYDSGSWGVRSRLPAIGYCLTGQRFPLDDAAANDGLQVTEAQAHDGLERWSGETVLPCALLPGWMQVTTSVPSQYGPERMIELSYVLPVRQNQPERSAE